MSEKNFINMEKAYSKNDEKDMEISYFLPEYCPNALKIVKANTFAGIKQKDVTDTQVFVQGHVSVHILYLSDDQNTLKSINFGEDFSCSFDIPENLVNRSGLSVLVKPYVVSCTCKIVSPRELNVRLRLCINADLYSNCEFEQFKDENQNTYTLEEDYTVSSRCLFFLDSQRLENEIEIESNLPQVSEIMYTEGVFFVENVQQTQETSKIIGSFELHCMYIPMNNGQEKAADAVNLVKKFPIEVECKNECINEKSVVVPSFNITGIQAQTSYDSYGENRVITFSVDYCLHCSVFNDTTISICTDAYSSEYASNTILDTKNFDKIVDVTNNIMSVREKIHVDMRNFLEICDCIAKFDTCTLETIEENNYATIRGNISIVGKGQNGEYNSASIPVMSRILIFNGKKLPKETRLEGSVFCQDVTVVVKEGESLCEMNASICVAAIQKDNIDYVIDVIEDVDKSVEKARDEIVICYPHKKQSLWEVAKHYSASPEIIKRVNNLDCDDISNKKIIVIP